MKKFLIKGTIFICMCSVIFSNITKLFVVKSESLQGIMNSFYSLEEDSLDVMFVGSCHMYSTIMPMELYKKQGITSHILASPGQDIPTSYFYIEEALKTQSPQVLVLDVFSINRDSTYISKEGFTEDAYASFSVLDFSLEKLNYIKEYPYDINYLETLFPFFKFHNRWKSLTENDVVSQPREVSVSKGWTLFWNECNDMPVDDIFEPLRFSYAENYKDTERHYNDIYRKRNLDETTIEYLNKIVELTSSYNIKLCFFIAPYTMEIIEAEKFNALKEYAESFSIPVVDLNDNNMIENLQFTYGDMIDYQHVNAEGAKKITNYMGNFLVEKYALKNRKSDLNYEQWNQDLVEWEKQIKNE